MAEKEKDISEVVDRILETRGKSAEAVIPILQDLQQQYNFLPEKALNRVSDQTDISAARLISVSTFYNQFRHTESGQHTISVCTGTA